MAPSDTTRFKLTVHYDGSEFHGWQLQPDQRTVQGDLQASLSRLADRPRVVVASGRTDAGVHATGQVVAVDMPPSWTPIGLRRSLNAILPDDIWIASSEVAAADFHPRYDAVARTYRYDVGLDPRAASPFHRRWCWVVGSDVDVTTLDRVARALPGTHSFAAFAKAGQPERGDLCSVHAALWSPWELGIRFTITANRYLHHMVRYLVGTMIEIGRGQRDPDELAGLLDGAEGLLTAPPAPAEGLFLAHVEYPSRSAPNHVPRPIPRESA